MDMKKYGNLDGLRTFAAIGIILMHMLANGNYWMRGIMHCDVNVAVQLIWTVIAKLGVLVQLFFIISAFGMCCGYYDKIKNNSITLNQFYKKRYLKILPFFALLVLIDIVMSGFASKSLIEGFADVSLLFGFLPNSNITVIGVGWTLGVIFAFYIIFPFFVFALWNKKRAWVSLIATIILAYLCDYYFLVDGEVVSCNLVRWLCFFVAGGLIYLYKDTIEKNVSKHRIIFLLIVVALAVAWYLNKINCISIIVNLLLFSSIICYAISVKSKILNNRVTRFISGISFEMYLSHMVIFRVVEKLQLSRMIENDVLEYCITTILVIIGVIVFSVVVQKIIDIIIKKLDRKVTD